MAFTAVDVPIQEMLQSDFIVDLAQIHNTNVLLLKDKLEDLINTFEIDISTISIGVDTPISNIKTESLVLQDTGFSFQTGSPNQIIARLSKNSSDLSVLNVDILNVDSTISADSVTLNDSTINDTLTVPGDSSFSGKIAYTGQLSESKETAVVDLEFDGVDTAVGTLNITDTSKTNIYVKLSAITATGATQVWDGSSFASGLANIELELDFDSTNPPAVNTSFTIYIVDIIEDSGSTSLALNVNSSSLPVTVKAGTNNNTSSAIIMHNDFASLGFKLGINPSSSDLLSSALSSYGSNASFNYIIDESSNDRLLIKSTSGMEVFS